MPETEESGTPTPAIGSAGEVFRAFLKLGLTSFGGPIAHLGYLRDEFVVRRKWIGEAGYADLIALCQFLPGPASSQAGFGIGLMRAGWPGALAAWTAFTLPSAVMLAAFAFGATAFKGPLGAGLVHGLKIVAVAVVAQAVWGMARALTPDWQRAAIAVVAAVLALLAPGSAAQIAAIAGGALGGLWLCRHDAIVRAGRLAVPLSRRTGAVLLATAVLLLGLMPLLSAAFPVHVLAMADAFYRAGALVFGGGHVVLPLLEEQVVQPGWVGMDEFLAGYGAAQAVPGPLFTVAAYLGAVMEPEPNGVPGAAIATLSIFLPGLLLVAGALPFWDAMRKRPLAQAALRGTNAAVVGLLAAALYDPLGTSTILAPVDLVLAFAGLLLLMLGRAPPWLVVLLLGGAGAGLTLL